MSLAIAAAVNALQRNSAGTPVGALPFLTDPEPGYTPSEEEEKEFPPLSVEKRMRQAEELDALLRNALRHH
ncbi:MAG: hypothetical protein H7270_08320 [Dermatophilaceae bacterium]|nr:hypothetical protein [Dermatophilaceae bacterium]